MLLDNGIANGQSQATATVLGGKVRVKNFIKVFLGYAMTLIGNGYFDILSACKLGEMILFYHDIS